MPLITSRDASRLTRDIFTACGAPKEESQVIADHLVGANLCGIDSHGIIRIPQYVQDVRAGVIKPGGPITVIRETPVSMLVDCGWNFGVVSAEKVAEVAVAKARQSGVAVIATQRCNHAGRLGHYLEKIGSQGFLGLSFCSGPKHGHFVVPWGGRDGRLAPNPLAYGVPVPERPPIVSDFSTSEVPEGKIRVFRNRNEKLPEPWILDSAGRPSTSPSDFYGPPRGCVVPFGGRHGYRGYALGLLVEVMGTTVAGYDSTEDRPGNGVSFIVFDPALLAGRDSYESNITKLSRYIRSSRPAAGFAEVLLPGEFEQRNRTRNLAEGIEVESVTWAAIVEVANSLNVHVSSRESNEVRD